MWFGLTPPQETTVACSARAIAETRGYATLDLVHDRQQFSADASHISALQARLNQEALPELRRWV